MPVILEQNYWLVWLGKVEGDLTALLKPAADNVLKAWPVRRRNSPRNNGAELLERVG
jgi:putative SOS response-associated peptidase YedK